MVTLGNQITKGYNVLFVNNMKHNLISVTQMYDQGHTLKFVLKKYRIKERDTGILVETTTITPKNVYILGKKEQRCFLGQVVESWLWEKIMGHRILTILS